MRVKKWNMFSKLIARAVRYRKLPSVVAVLTVVLGVGVVIGLVNVYEDMSRKMSKEFRAYGANLLVYPTDAEARIGTEAAEALARHLAGDKLFGMALVQYGIVQAEKKPFVVVGTTFVQMKLVSPYWNVEGAWAEDGESSTDAMVGTEIAAKFDLKPGSEWNVAGTDTGAQVKLNVKGIVTTGGKEDNQIFVPLQLSQKLTGSKKADIVLVSLLEKGDALERQAAALEKAVPAVAVKPLKQMAKSEAALVEKIRKLIFLVSIIIIGTTVLTVTTTMISMVMERRKEIGLKKAIGASDRKLIGEFLAEGAVLGLTGSALGVVLAHYIAQLIGRTVFHAEVAFQTALVPWACLGTLLVIGVAFIVPVKRMMEIEPAIVLKGE